MSDFAKETHYCDNCSDYTECLCSWSKHERDTSGDMAICLKCHFRYSGYTGEWEEPDDLTLSLEKSIIESLEKQANADKSNYNI